MTYKPGVILRNGPKKLFEFYPPILGEMIYATDTNEHGWITTDGRIVWANLSPVESKEHIVYKGTNPNSIEGELGDKYMCIGKPNVLNIYHQEIELEFITNHYIFITEKRTINYGTSSGDDIIDTLECYLNETILENGDLYIDFYINIRLSNYDNIRNRMFYINEKPITFPKGEFDENTSIWSVSFKGVEYSFYGYEKSVGIYNIIKDIYSTQQINITRYEKVYNDYQEYTRTESGWMPYNLKRFLIEIPLNSRFEDDPNGTVYYILPKPL